MSTDPTTADTSSALQSNEAADPLVPTDEQRPILAEPTLHEEMAYAAEYEAEAAPDQPPHESGPWEATLDTVEAEDSGWAEAPMTDDEPALVPSHGESLEHRSARAGAAGRVPTAEYPNDRASFGMSSVPPVVDAENQPEAVTAMLLAGMPEAVTPELQSLSMVDILALPQAQAPAELDIAEPQPSASEEPALIEVEAAQVTPSLQNDGDELVAAEPPGATELHDSSTVEPLAPPPPESAEPEELSEFAPSPEHIGYAEYSAYSEPTTWEQQPTEAEPPTWSQPPTYAEPASPAPDVPPVDPWPAAQAASPYAPLYTQPVYAPAPSGYSQLAAYPAAVYAPPAPPPQRRWPLVLGTGAAVAIVAALALAFAANSFNLFGPATPYHNDMTSVTKGWPNDVECQFKSDGYHIKNASNCYYSAADYRDVTITVTAKLLKGDPTATYGIAFRRPSPNNFYVFLITGNGEWLALKNNVQLRKVTSNPAINTGVGAVNTLSVRLQGAHFTFFANGAQLGDLSDDSYSSGKVGLAGDQNIEAVFKDFTVTRG
jgi:hypothetical protein